ncbi:unnamed protein product, partial [Leptidea sinapis]
EWSGACAVQVEEAARWAGLRVSALRADALRRRDVGALREALRLAEKYSVDLREVSSFEDTLVLRARALALRLSDNSFREVLSYVRDHHGRGHAGDVGVDAIDDICRIAIAFYDQRWRRDTDECPRRQILEAMLEVVRMRGAWSRGGEGAGPGDAL